MKKSETAHDRIKEWDSAIAHNTALFRAADLLEEAAYRFIQFGDLNNDIWLCFSEAKALADAKRRVAYEDWLRIKSSIGRQ